MDPSHFDDSSILKSQAIDSICRICFDLETEEHKLINPCKCSGSMRYIHEDCLKIWLLSQDKDLITSSCDICKSTFKMQISLTTKCTCKNYWNECIGIFILPIVIMLMSSIFIVILMFLVQGIRNKSSSAGEQTYLILLMIASAVITIIVVGIFVKTVKRGCCSAEVENWRIDSVEHEQALEETIEQHASGQTAQNEEIQVMVMPKMFRVKGRSVVRPLIVTTNLVPVMREGELVAYRSRPVTTRSLGGSQPFSPGSQMARSDNNFSSNRVDQEPNSCIY